MSTGMATDPVPIVLSPEEAVQQAQAQLELRWRQAEEITRQQEQRERALNDRERRLNEQPSFSIGRTYTEEPQREKEDKVKIPPFDGTADKCREFLMNLKLHFASNPRKYSSAHEKILFALRHMQGGTAGPWKSNYINQHTDKDDEFISTNSYPKFKQIVEDTFAGLKLEQEAEQKMRELKQEKMPIQELVTKFEILMHQANMTEDKRRIDFFCNCIKP